MLVGGDEVSRPRDVRRLVDAGAAGHDIIRGVRLVLDDHGPGIVDGIGSCILWAQALRMSNLTACPALDRTTGLTFETFAVPLRPPFRIRTTPGRRACSFSRGWLSSLRLSPLAVAFSLALEQRQDGIEGV